MKPSSGMKKVPSTLKATELMHRKQVSITSANSLMESHNQNAKTKKKTDSFSLQPGHEDKVNALAESEFRAFQ